MALIDEVRKVCDRLAPQGWGELLAQHGLDIKAADLAAELGKRLTKIARGAKGFEDFAHEGERGIEPGHPARSLLYHALASPNVLTQVGGDEAKFCPMRFRTESDMDDGVSDRDRRFWQPLHKLFPGAECLGGVEN